MSLTVCRGVDLRRKAAAASTKTPYESPFSANCLRVAPDRCRIDHMLPVIGETQLSQRFQKRVPNALFGQRRKRT